MQRNIASLFFLALGLLASTLPVHGVACALDGGPAATLLLPYFEVDLANPGGRTTLFAINNAGDKAVVAHVVLWTDLAVPTLAFDVYLTGFDVQTLNLRDVFQGILPRTADAARDPGDSISPKGELSQDVTFPGCTALPPQASAREMVDHLRRAHTGQPSPVFGGKCAGHNHGQSSVARGYATVDVVKDCTFLRPGDAGYFGAGGVAASDNVLWGDFFYVDPDGKFAQGEDLVRLHADPGRFKAGDPTFYARLVNHSAADAREPLPFQWATRYLTGGLFDGGTDLVAWRDGPWTGQPFDCGPVPPGVPQEQREVLVFDEQENVLLPPPCPILCPPTTLPLPFPFAASRVTVGASNLPTPFNFGWIRFDLRSTPEGADDPFAQAWVGQVSSAQGRFSVGYEGTAMASSCTAGRCSEGNDTLVGDFCVFGPLQAGQPARFRVRPQGCFSSGCTRTFQAGCAVQRSGSDLNLDALFCLQSPTADVCTPDCSGGGTALCSSGPLEAGNYVARLAGRELHFTVPSEIDTCLSPP